VSEKWGMVICGYEACGILKSKVYW